MARVYRSTGYPCGVGDCKEVLASAGALGGHRSQHHPMPTERATLTELRAAGLQPTRDLHDGVPIFDGWRHAGLGASGDPIYVRVCDGCGLDFGHPKDQTRTKTGRELCRACATVEGEVDPW